jgi:hypothetical protein
MIIPPARLSAEVLRSIAEAFVLREGTDYGDAELSLASKVDDVLSQLSRGEVLVVYDEASESVNILTREEFARLGE